MYVDVRADNFVPGLSSATWSVTLGGLWYYPLLRASELDPQVLLALEAVAVDRWHSRKELS